ncbi:hypothetical protein EJ05DRAFT_44777 [Pseudovirgaria hyperparasitica]|uniref:Uncharacterized protein n=1 Tax=Pseudovirgaria hyperparasitica TaxID=470096 RepID=A0A6A6W3T6_9PEZI|nr:uncharacterized protein EJ05DRAFT_44777 [Pseudovirgaria hyperparasitica]KAF2756819.1 hypothetical protein EJ05DRAFT_44777 [Pseudovirgaria hyperparasitica]
MQSRIQAGDFGSRLLKATQPHIPRTLYSDPEEPLPFGDPPAAAKTTETQSPPEPIESFQTTSLPEKLSPDPTRLQAEQLEKVAGVEKTPRRYLGRKHKYKIFELDYSKVYNIRRPKPEESVGVQSRGDSIDIAQKHKHHSAVQPSTTPQQSKSSRTSSCARNYVDLARRAKHVLLLGLKLADKRSLFFEAEIPQVKFVASESRDPLPISPEPKKPILSLDVPVDTKLTSKGGRSEGFSDTLQQLTSSIPSLTYTDTTKTPTSPDDIIALSELSTLKSLSKSSPPLKLGPNLHLGSGTTPEPQLNLISNSTSRPTPVHQGPPIPTPVLPDRRPQQRQGIDPLFWQAYIPGSGDPGARFPAELNQVRSVSRASLRP